MQARFLGVAATLTYLAVVSPSESATHTFTTLKVLPVHQTFAYNLRRGCPGPRRRERVCARWWGPHGSAPVCVRYVWVNKCTT